MKATAIAPSNIAFIKYWGRKDARLRLPRNASISMNLSASTTTTTVEFSKELVQDKIELLESGGFSDGEVSRIVRQLDVVRSSVGVKLFARVATKNTFPKSSGAASSASGFAALTMASMASLKADCSQKELTILARLGSGSACRSIPDGFVKWEEGDDSTSSFAHSIYPESYWDIHDVLVIVDRKSKDVSSSAGHDTVMTSPYFLTRLQQLPQRIVRIESAMKRKDFQIFGEVIEEDCLDMHHVMQTQVPPLMYWNDATKQIMNAVVEWRRGGLPVYFTIDAGPNVHLICEEKDEQKVSDAVKRLSGVEEIILNKPSKGAHIISEHLF